jgi:hypothetical protein
MSMLVYLAREWNGKRVKELGKELHRDPSIVSQLRRESGSAGRGSAAATGFQINQSERPPRLLTLGLSGSRNNKIPLMKPDTVS